MTALDRLHPAVRHFILMCVVTALSAGILHVAGAVTQAGDVLSVDWPETWSAALNATALAFAAGLSGWFGLYITPLTRQYGIGAEEAPSAALVIPDWMEDEPEPPASVIQPDPGDAPDDESEM